MALQPAPEQFAAQCVGCVPLPCAATYAISSHPQQFGGLPALAQSAANRALRPHRASTTRGRATARWLCHCRVALQPLSPFCFRLGLAMRGLSPLRSRSSCSRGLRLTHGLWAATTLGRACASTTSNVCAQRHNQVLKRTRRGMRPSPRCALVYPAPRGLGRMPRRSA